MDFSALTPTPSQFDKPSAVDNPCIAWVAASYEAKETRAVAVPASEAKGLHGLLVRAATELNLGVKVRINDGKNDHVPSKELWAQLEGSKAKVTVKFTGKTRVLRPRGGAETASE